MYPHPNYRGPTIDRPMTNACYKCNGTGKFITTKGRVHGDCFQCNGTGKKPQPSAPVNSPAPVTLAFPKTIDLVLRNNIRLHLGEAKIVVSQSGAICLVSPKYGFGFYGTFREDGSFRRNAACTDEMVRRLQDVEARGLEAVKEIGRLTGICCVCGRTLTNEASIEDGIGPVCAGRMA